jgi:predicted RNA-binding protein YlxR (DUF448 family)
MARQKHKPQRTCVACREVKDKRDLIRVIRTPEGKVVLTLRARLTDAVHIYAGKQVVGKKV